MKNLFSWLAMDAGWKRGVMGTGGMGGGWRGLGMVRGMVGRGILGMFLGMFLGILGMGLMGGRVEGQVPQMINYAGRVAVGAVNFEGAGQFKFALVDGLGTTTYWSNDGTSVGGNPPTGVVTLAVSGGMYSVLLGNAAIPQMTVVPPTAFNHPDVRLRVWFSDGMSGFQLMTPDQRIAAVGYAMMATNAQTANTAGTATTVVDGAITAAKIAPGAVGGSQLAAGAVSASLVASGQSVVPSGGMILSRMESDPSLIGAGYAAMGNQFVLDLSWAQRQSSLIGGRDSNVAAWSGTELIVWGGYNNTGILGDGARYNPLTNAWSAMSSVGAPSARTWASGVWSGTELIVWGGRNSVALILGDGARYNPLTDVWTVMSSVGAPSARYGQCVAWSGTEMIVWGGYFYNNGVSVFLGDGARYNPLTNAWAVMSSVGAPTGRYGASGVWSGTELIVWGGRNGNTGVQYSDGARYNPVTNTWNPMSSVGAPSGRLDACVVWSGTEVIVWGGYNPNGTFLADGARYNPVTNAWTVMSNVGGPSARYKAIAVWSGTEMVVWGGLNSTNILLGDGARYNPLTNAWSAMSSVGAPSARGYASGVWSGTEMVVWGGVSGETSTYYPNDTYTWSPSRIFYLYNRP